MTPVLVALATTPRTAEELIAPQSVVDAALALFAVAARDAADSREKP
jgi:hypothetical protein